MSTITHPYPRADLAAHGVASDHTHVCEWVSDDGHKGDGQRLYAGKGVNFYKAHIRLREKEYRTEARRRPS